jgi:short subunit dehydrogenase-like uncharacterized protein
MPYVGPFALYGEAVIKACVEHKTDYADITGEVFWVQDMMRKYGEAARKNGVLPTLVFIL